MSEIKLDIAGKLMTVTVRDSLLTVYYGGKTLATVNLVEMEHQKQLASWGMTTAEVRRFVKYEEDRIKRERAQEEPVDLRLKNANKEIEDLRERLNPLFSSNAALLKRTGFYSVEALETAWLAQKGNIERAQVLLDQRTKELEEVKVKAFGLNQEISRLRDSVDSMQLELNASEHHRIAGNKELIARAEKADAHNQTLTTILAMIKEPLPRAIAGLKNAQGKTPNDQYDIDQSVAFLKHVSTESCDGMKNWIDQERKQRIAAEAQLEELRAKLVGDYIMKFYSGDGRNGGHAE